jgi:hypothetical protein
MWCAIVWPIFFGAVLFSIIALFLFVQTENVKVECEDAECLIYLDGPLCNIVYVNSSVAPCVFNNCEGAPRIVKCNVGKNDDRCPTTKCIDKPNYSQVQAINWYTFIFATVLFFGSCQWFVSLVVTLKERGLL